MNVGAEIGEDRGGRVGQVVEHLHDPALFGDEHAAVRREANRRGPGQAAEHHVVNEPWRQRRRRVDGCRFPIDRTDRKDED
jgi:hypothetical protein